MPKPRARAARGRRARRARRAGVEPCAGHLAGVASWPLRPPALGHGARGLGGRCRGGLATASSAGVTTGAGSAAAPAAAARATPEQQEHGSAEEGKTASPASSVVVRPGAQRGIRSGSSIRGGASTPPGVLRRPGPRRCTTAGSLQRRKGLMARSSADGRRQRLAAPGRAAPGSAMYSCSAALPGSTAAAKRRLDRVYSWVQQTRVSAGSAASAQRVRHLRRRAFEEPAAAGGEQRVAAEQQRRTRHVRSAGRRCGPRVWPGTSMTSKRAAQHLDAVAFGSGTKGCGIFSRAGPQTGPSSRAATRRRRRHGPGDGASLESPPASGPVHRVQRATGAASPGSTTRRRAVVQHPDVVVGEGGQGEQIHDA
jgi:hypothetical protein